MSNLSRDGHKVKRTSNHATVYICFKQMKAWNSDHIFGSQEVFDLEINEHGNVSIKKEPGQVSFVPEWVQVVYEDYIAEKELGICE
jgi:hypothetical protein